MLIVGYCKMWTTIRSTLKEQNNNNNNNNNNENKKSKESKLIDEGRVG